MTQRKIDPRPVSEWTDCFPDLRYFSRGNCTLTAAESTLTLGRQLAETLGSDMNIYLQGSLGTGKTTLARGILSGMGYSGAVRSPTYTLMEIYQLATATVCHLDLYRISDASELDDIGFRDYLTLKPLCLIEWPEQGWNYLPIPDLILSLTAGENHHQLEWVNCNNDNNPCIDIFERF